MAKITLSDLSNLQNEQTAVGRINTNNALIEAAVENTLSRDGTEPNEMNADLDMNNHRIYNLPEPVSNTEPVRRQEVAEILDLADEFEEALEDAQAAVDAYTAMQALYLGEKTSFPTADNQGNPLQNGVLISLVDQADPLEDGMYVYHEGSWSAVGELPVALSRVEVIRPAAGATSVPVPGGYTPGSATAVYRNGSRQIVGDSPSADPEDPDVTAADGVNLVFPVDVIQEDDSIVVTISSSYLIGAMGASDVTFSPSGSIAATSVQNAIVELDTEKVPTTRAITTTGLLTGGGTLAADKAFDVPIASNAEALAGSDNTKAMTPLRVSEAIVAAGSSPGLTLINTFAVASGVITVPLGSTYTYFKIVGSMLMPLTNGEALQIQIAVDGVPTYISTAGAYTYAGTSRRAGTASADWQSAADTKVVLSPAQNNSGSPNFCNLEAYLSNTVGGFCPSFDWNLSTRRQTSNELNNVNASAYCVATSSAWTHIRFGFATGNMHTSGQIKLYGFN